MIMATKTNSRRTALWWCLACIACIASPALAKVETGTVKLDSVTTEQLIGRFGVTEKGSLTLKLTTAKKGWERGEHALHILVFRDESYKRWRDMIKKGSLCQERNRLADIEKAVDLPHPLATHAGHGFEYFVDPETGRSYRINLETGDSDWAEPDNHPEGPLNRVEHRETTFTTTLAHHRPKGRGRDVERVPVSAHWYVVVADCRLEFYDAHPPPMKYHLTFLRGDEGERGGTLHLPADLRGVGVLYWTLMVASPPFPAARRLSGSTAGWAGYTRSSWASASRPRCRRRPSPWSWRTSPSFPETARVCSGGSRSSPLISRRRFSRASRNFSLR